MQLTQRLSPGRVVVAQPRSLTVTTILHHSPLSNHSWDSIDREAAMAIANAGHLRGHRRSRAACAGAGESPERRLRVSEGVLTKG